jgi:hypothetical protein
MSVAGIIPVGTPGNASGTDVLLNTGNKGNVIYPQSCGKGNPVNHFQTMAQQTESRNICHGMDASHQSQFLPQIVQFGHKSHGFFAVFPGCLSEFDSGTNETYAQRLGQV